jgi:putative ubiquitin-RnfH superfamily antitoxin RatB of RatAB toxin-antitoxin module
MSSINIVYNAITLGFGTIETITLTTNIHGVIMERVKVPQSKKQTDVVMFLGRMLADPSSLGRQWIRQ